MTTEVTLTVIMKVPIAADNADAERLASWLNDLILENAPFELEFATVGVESVEEE